LIQRYTGKIIQNYTGKVTMKKNKKKKFWTQKVWNWKWEIWLTCLMISVLCLVLLFLMYTHYYAQQPQFVYNSTGQIQTCHHYNDKTYCCSDHPRYTVYTNLSETVVEHYICQAIRLKTLKEPYIQGIDYNYETMEYE